MLKDSMNCNTTDSFLICRAVNVSLQSWGCVVEEGQLLLLLLLQGGQPDCLGREGVFFFHSLAQKQSDLVNKSWSVWLKCCSSFRWREDLQIITLLTLIHETKWNAFFFPTWFFYHHRFDWTCWSNCQKKVHPVIFSSDFSLMKNVMRSRKYTKENSWVVQKNKSSALSMHFIGLHNNVMADVERRVALNVATARKCVTPIFPFFCKQW